MIQTSTHLFGAIFSVTMSYYFNRHFFCYCRNVRRIWSTFFERRRSSQIESIIRAYLRFFHRGRCPGLLRWQNRAMFLFLSFSSSLAWREAFCPPNRYTGRCSYSAVKLQLIGPNGTYGKILNCCLDEVQLNSGDDKSTPPGEMEACSGILKPSHNKQIQVQLCCLVRTRGRAYAGGNNFGTNSLFWTMLALISMLKLCELCCRQRASAVTAM